MGSDAPGSPASADNGETLSSPAQALQAYQAKAMRQLTILAVFVSGQHLLITGAPA